MRSRLLVLTLALLSLGFAPAPLPKPAKKKVVVGGATLQQLQGTWALTSLSRWQAGKLSESRLPAGAFLEVTITRDEWTMTLKGKAGPKGMKIRLNTSQNPVWMDLSYPDRPTTMQGIVRVIGNEMEFCYVTSQAAPQRPAQFPPSAAGQIMMKLQRK